jgi:alkylation response protein AidB-like acyl-CoA dehydrogenase
MTTGDAHNTLDDDRARRLRESEELLFTGPQRLGVAKGLFLGRFASDWVMPYPSLAPDQQQTLDVLMPRLKPFLDDTLDPVAIDRAADIPREVIDGLGRLGVLGLAAPTEFGGQGFSQLAYCHVLEEIGARCASTSVFVNAHHSIGLRALVLFGNPAQKARWLPQLARGEQLAAFALTEPHAGSDAANVQTLAERTDDGSAYILNGEKRYITNAAIAQVLTVMARTDRGVTAFLVTPDMPGFSVTEARMAKLGIRGTATGRLAFHNMRVPAENVLGSPGEGLKLALTVLDFGRTTFGACCTGAAKTCLRLAVAHASTREQFGRSLSDFELIKAKIARMAADTYAMEAMTTVTASLIDRGLEDYMIETAMLKVYTTEALWTIVNDAFQIHGGAAYFTDLPLERMLRDARINQIGEGANEVLTSFIALAGMRGPGVQLRDLWHALHHPLADLGTVWRFGVDRVSAAVRAPDVPVRDPRLSPYAQRVGKLIRRFNIEVSRVLIHHRESVLDRQYVQQCIAGAAVELFVCACVLSRADAELAATADPKGGDMRVVELCLRRSLQRVRRWLAKLHDNDDLLVTAAADAALGK